MSIFSLRQFFGRSQRTEIAGRCLFATFFPKIGRDADFSHPPKIATLAIMSEAIQVVTTLPQLEAARQIARRLVERRLAACVQIVGPIQSIYRWQGEIESAEEWQCWAKSRRELFDAVKGAIRESHPYEVPEILAMPITTGDDDYLAWLDAQIECPRACDD